MTAQHQTEQSQLRFQRSDPPVTRLRGVRKQLTDSEYLNGIDLELYPGEVLVLVEPHVSGRTLLINSILGLHQPDEGEIEIFGRQPGDPEVLDRIGALTFEMDFPSTLKVEEVVALVRAHYTDPLPEEELYERFAMQDFRSRRIGQLTPAEQRWLAVMLAFAGDPEAVFLDLPTSGMDIGWRWDLWRLLHDYCSRGGAVLTSTHFLDEAESFASRIAVMHQGRIVAIGTPEEITTKAGLKLVTLRADREPRVPGVDHLEQHGDGWRLYTQDTDALIRELVRSDIACQHISTERSNLEAAVLQLTRGDQ